jgi:putative transcriptional regulator
MKNRVRELREKHGLTQQNLAEEVRVTRQTIIGIEKGKYNPSLELAFKLAVFFQAPVEELFEYGKT